MTKVKLFTGVALGLFFVTVTAILTAAFLTKSGTPGEAAMKSGLTKLSQGVSEEGSMPTYLTVEEVAKHATLGDCWLIIDGAVYDVTAFLSAHPGGSDSITPYCGKEATAAFATKDKTPATKHSTIADDMLGQYFVGRIGQQLATADGGSQSASGISKIGATPTKGVTAMAGSGTTTSTLTGSLGSGLSLTTGEVARHNNLADCWLVISGKVYNLTSYVVQHPGGADAIARYCGGDGTAAFGSKDKSPGVSHSSFAQSLLGNYLVGTVGQTVAVNPIAPTNPVVPTSAPGAPTSTPAPGPVPTNTPVPTLPPANVALTMTEVGKHNNLADCWLLISNKVYNVTSYIVQHPGGASAITNMCGKESTSAFQTRGGGGGNHSNSAYNLLAGYYIGDLNSSVPVNPTSTPVPGGSAPTSTPVPGGGGGGDLPAAITGKYPGATKISGKYEDDGNWEGKINTASGQCREMKVNSSGSITKDSSC